jgi:hypothetical protein
LFGKELKKLKQTSLKTMFSEAMPILKLQEKVHYWYSELRGEIRFSNGSEIITLDLSDRPSDPNFEYLGGLEFMSGAGEEVSQLSEKAVNMIMSRIRYKLDQYCPCGFPTFSSKILETNLNTGQPTKWKCLKHNCGKETTGLSPKVILTCNPSRGWLYNEYYKKWKDGTLESHKAFIPALLSDNDRISAHYKTNLDRQDPITRARLRDGNWEYQDSLNMFDLDKLNEMFEDSAHILEDDVAPNISTASDMFIKPILTESYYNYLLNIYSAQTLSAQQEILVNKIKPALAWRSAEMTIPFLYARISNKGPQNQNGEFSQSVDREQMSYLRNELENRAEFYEQALVQHLRDNYSLYPEFAGYSGNNLSDQFDSTIAPYDDSCFNYYNCNSYYPYRNFYS